MKTVIVVGGGVGGLVAAREVRRRLSPGDRVVLVERSARHVFAPSLPWLVVGWRQPDRIVRDISWLPKQGIDLVVEEAVAIDPENRVVVTAAREVRGDAVVVALGAERSLAGIPGLGEAAHEFYSLEGAERLREALDKFQGGRVAVVIAQMPYSCPAAPYEATLLIEEFLRRRQVEGEVAVYTPEPYPMPTAGPEVGRELREMIEARGIGFHPQVRVLSVEGRGLALSDGTRAECDLLVAIPAHQAPEVVRRSSLAGQSGWIPVDPRTLATRFEGVYALGDVAAVPLPGRFNPDVPLSLPKAGVFAHRQADVVAENVATLVEGGTPPGLFDGKGFCFVEMGEGRAGFGSGDFFASPAPRVQLRPPGRQWHWGKELFERTWLNWVEGKRSGETIGSVMSAWAEKYL